MTKIEEVARAILAEIEKVAQVYPAIDSDVPRDLRSLAVDGEIDLTALAVAAVAVMREPNAAILAGMKESSVGGELYFEDDFNEAWRTAIDAALAEHKAISPANDMKRETP